MPIHPFAYVHPEAQVHESAVIEAGAWIGDNVVIGAHTWIGPHAIIMDGSRIGEHCKIYPGAVISGDPQDLKYKGEKTLTIIGDYTTIREHVTINKGTEDKLKTQIGNHCLVMAYCHIAHDCIIGDHCIFSNNSTLAGHIIVEDYVTVAGLAAIQQFLRIGQYAYVAGGSMVRKSVPPFVRAAREPLSYIGVNSVGLTRRGFSQEQVNNIHEIYRRLYLSKTNVSDALVMIESEFEPTSERDAILTFIKETAVKGIIRGPHSTKEEV
jgi:UDP-N-acetylglucosamine acyltransferase